VLIESENPTRLDIRRRLRGVSGNEDWGADLVGVHGASGRIVTGWKETLHWSMKELEFFFMYEQFLRFVHYSEYLGQSYCIRISAAQVLEIRMGI
jgi:hypothetical protein